MDKGNAVHNNTFLYKISEMNNTQFLRDKPLEILVSTDKLRSARLLLVKAQESHRLFWEEESDGINIILRIRIETTAFANGYFYLGKLFHESNIFQP